MEHHFDIEVAKKFGVHAAVIYKNIQHWCLKNRSNEKHFYNGEYWTYNSVKAFNDLFPYLTESQIRTAINKLVEKGWIGVGNYNSSSYDRTKWYCDLRKLHLSINANGNEINHEPIPYNKPYSNTDKKTADSNVSMRSTFQQNNFEKSNFDEVDPNKVNGQTFKTEKSCAKKDKEFGKREFRQTLLDLGINAQYVDDWISVRTSKKAVFTATALQLILDECKKHNFPIEEAIKMCAGKGWQTFKYQWYLNENKDGTNKPVTAGQDRQQRIDGVKRMGSLARQIINDAISNASASDK
ncbi:MAG: hypothetical protein LBJ04_22845 [Sphingobacterium sp.]|jgi:hypothetical protein|nr:hypothetical protein [Sphingobacterium sp.]